MRSNTPEDPSGGIVSPLSVDGETYLVRDTGGAGPAVLLAHGWPDDSALWRHQHTALARSGFRAVSFDWPGHGGSSTPADVRRCAVPRLAADVVGLLDRLDLASAHLVAHDYGATVAWEAVSRWPERFRSFTAVSVGHPLEVLRDVVLGGAVRYRWLVAHGLDSSRRRYLADGARRFRAAFASHPDADRVLEKLVTDDEPFFFTVWEKANPAHAVTARALTSGRGRRYPGPTLAIFSREDEWMTEAQLARSYRRVAGPWTYHAMAGGHWVPLERPEQFNAVLLPWLTAVAGRPAPG